MCTSTQFPEAIRDITYWEYIFSSFFSTLVEFPYVYAVRLGFKFLVRFISPKYIPVLLNIFQVFIIQNLKVP
jgi:hypothetical protein